MIIKIGGINLKNMSKSYLEISKENLRWNVKQIRRKIGSKVKLLAIIKANAYGHGLKEISLLLKNKVDYFGVDNIEEALKIRSLKIKNPILVLGFVSPEEFNIAANKNISIAFYNRNFIEEVKKIKFQKPLKIHLKIETGMHRQGIDLDGLTGFTKEIKKHSSKLILEGVYSHFSEAGDLDFSENQFEKLQKAIKVLNDLGFNKFIKHISASSGTLNGKKYHLDMIRAGICLYGYLPYSKPKTLNKNLKTKSVLTWKSVVAQVKFVEKDEFVGYGRTWQAKKRTKIAVIPVGYSDGFDRRFSNNGEIFIKGKSAEIIGRVAMNMFTVNVTKIKNIKVGDEVLILKDADKMAERIDTINHEILARINPQIPRVVV